ncbi:MAG TPA: hypothetical protein VGE51_05825 [Fontimonas sp.]
MSAGAAYRSTSGLALSLLLALGAPAALAADGEPGCQTYVDSQWQPAKAASMSGCLLQLDAATTVYDAQGFKFGLWGTTLLSADVRYFYSSMDSGASWQVVGEKASITPDSRTAQVAQAQPQAAAAAAAEGPAPVKSGGIFSRITDFFTTADDKPQAETEEALAPRPVTAEMPAPATYSRNDTAGVPARSGAPAATVSQAPGNEPLHSCNMRLGSRWEVVNNQTLQQCISLFDRSPDQFDSNGYKYGYWGGIYLAANRSEVLQSTNSREWTTVLNR